MIALIAVLLFTSDPRLHLAAKKPKPRKMAPAKPKAAPPPRKTTPTQASPTTPPPPPAPSPAKATEPPPEVMPPPVRSAPAEPKYREPVPLRTTRELTPSPEQPKRAPGSLILDVELGARGFHRRLSLVDDLFAQFYPHSHAIAVAPAAKLRYFPGAHVTSGVGSWFGVYLHGHMAPGLGARLPDDTRLNITAFEAGGGLVVRYGSERVEVVLELGALAHSWVFVNAPANAISVSYLGFRPGLELRFNLASHFAFRIGGDVRVLLSNSATAATFPRTSGLGVKGLVGVIVPIALGFEARIDGEYNHYGLSMSPRPGDSFVLGGALDQYFGGTVSLALRL